MLNACEKLCALLKVKFEMSELREQVNVVVRSTKLVSSATSFGEQVRLAYAFLKQTMLQNSRA